MQPRMLKRPLKQEEIDDLLASQKVGHLATLGEDGPYVLPINYALMGGKVYLHGRKAGGQKLDNIRADPRICFAVNSQAGYETGPTPCDTEAIFQSAIGRGTARILEDGDPLIEAALLKFAEKFATHIKDPIIEPAKLAVTAVIELTINQWTGKYYK
ncbi:MAG: pyridoxamine 5'-phosphate oxidase family protein [Deltaproteobacteria bacterium]|nr:pyridoxamine 5'-phosphate oxidase family protein [Deltaproteobacteria bacterium]